MNLEVKDCKKVENSDTTFSSKYNTFVYILKISVYIMQIEITIFKQQMNMKEFTTYF